MKSDRCLNVATVFLLQNQLLGVTIADCVHLPAAQNTAADVLSRHRDSVPLLSAFMNDASFENLREVPLREVDLLSLCDPNMGDEGGNSSFDGRWQKVRDAVLSS